MVASAGTPIELVFFNQQMKESWINQHSAFDLRMNSNFFYSYKNASFFRIKLLNLGLRISSRENFGFKNFSSLLNEWSLGLIEASYLFFDRGSRLKIARGIGFSPNFKSSKRNTTLLGYFQSEKFASELKNAESLLGWSPNFQSDIFPQIVAEADNSKPLIVHVRLGDYLAEDSFGIMSAEYYKESVTNLWQSGRYKKIWLFSDQ